MLLALSGCCAAARRALSLARFPWTRVASTRPFVTSYTENVVESDLQHVALQVQARKIREALKKETRDKISVNEFVQLCSRFNFSTDESHDLLDAFHTSGQVLHFKDSKHPKLASIVFLNPDEMAETIYSRLGVGKEFLSEQVEKKEELLKDLRQEFSSLDTLYQSMDGRAQRHAKRVLFTGLVALTSQFAVYAHLTWFVFSWDVMEPITFFVSQAAAILFYSYFAFCKRDFSYDELFNFFHSRKLNGLLRNSGFNKERHAELAERIRETESMLEKYKKATFWLS